MSKIFDFVKPGVITGDDVQKVFQVAKENNFALPAVNCVGTDSIKHASSLTMGRDVLSGYSGQS